MTTIYLDMDGVLVDFCGAVAQLFERPDYVPVEFDFLSELAGSEAAFWKRVDATPHFWENLPAYPWTDSLLCLTYEFGSKVAIASHPKDAVSEVGKRKWVAKHAAHLPCHFSLDKTIHACTNSILVDDCEQNVLRWQQQGGMAILFPQPWNANRWYTNDRVAFVRECLNGDKSTLYGAANVDSSAESRGCCRVQRSR